MINYFKQHTGKTVNAYLRDMKCELAYTSLETTRFFRSIFRRHSGITAGVILIEFFKEHTGLLPAAKKLR